MRKTLSLIGRLAIIAAMALMLAYTAAATYHLAGFIPALAVAMAGIGIIALFLGSELP